MDRTPTCDCWELTGTENRQAILESRSQRMLALIHAIFAIKVWLVRPHPRWMNDSSSHPSGLPKDPLDSCSLMFFMFISSSLSRRSTSEKIGLPGNGYQHPTSQVTTCDFEVRKSHHDSETCLSSSASAFWTSIRTSRSSIRLTASLKTRTRS